jgi:hypothetical protein
VVLVGGLSVSSWYSWKKKNAEWKKARKEWLERPSHETLFRGQNQWHYAGCDEGCDSMHPPSCDPPEEVIQRHLEYIQTQDKK